jgi:hypothetical protein
MRLSLFEADLEKDRPIILEILNRNRDYHVDDSRYDWLYLKNPAGKARVWLARDDHQRKIIGAAAALPRLMWVRERQELCQVLADFSIDPAFRTLGPAIKLNRMSLTPVLDGTSALAYDFPSRSMAVAHRWLQFQPVGKLLRFVRPMSLDACLRVDPKFGKVKQVANGLLRTAQKLYPCRNIDKHFSFCCEPAAPGTFDDSFSILDNLVGVRYPVCGSRNAAYLKWRYGMNTLRQFYTLRLMRNNELSGFAIYVLKDLGKRQRLFVYDLYGEEKLSTQRNLLIALCRVGDERNVDAIEVSVLHSNPWIGILKRFGFRQRSPAADVFRFTRKDCALFGISGSADNWFITQGDRDT